MRSWFTVDRLDTATFVISEWGHWEETHCYLLNGKEDSLLLDTGLGVENIRAIVEKYAAFEPLVVTTHAHWDHIGGHALFSRIALHEAELSWLDGRFPLPQQTVLDNLLRPPHRIPDTFRSSAYTLYQGAPTQVLRGGEVIDLGDRLLEVLHTPGHSPGHVCLYERKRGYLFTGDLIYSGTLYAFYPTTDPVLYHASVRLVRTLPARQILPAHHTLDLSPSFVETVYEGFEQLWRRDLLCHGTGLHPFEGFVIHL